MSGMHPPIVLLVQQGHGCLRRKYHHPLREFDIDGHDTPPHPHADFLSGGGVQFSSAERLVLVIEGHLENFYDLMAPSDA